MSLIGLNQFSTNIPTIPDRIMSRIEIDEKTGCWNWTATLNRCGYGVLWIGGKKGNYQFAHRLSYEQYHPLTTDIQQNKLYVLHKCIGNRRCCNPGHLYLGTPQNNMDDRREQGRENASKGEAVIHHKLTEAQVIQIREMYKNGGHSYTTLGVIFGVRSSTIGSIITRRYWKHI